MAKITVKMISTEIPIPALDLLESPLGVEEMIAVVSALLVAVDLLIDDAGVPFDTVTELDMKVIVDSVVDELSSFNISVSVLCHATGIPSLRIVRPGSVEAVTVNSWFPSEKTPNVVIKFGSFPV